MTSLMVGYHTDPFMAILNFIYLHMHIIFPFKKPAQGADSHYFKKINLGIALDA